MSPIPVNLETHNNFKSYFVAIQKKYPWAMHLTLILCTTKINACTCVNYYAAVSFGSCSMCEPVLPHPELIAGQWKIHINKIFARWVACSLSKLIYSLIYSKLGQTRAK